MKKVKTNPKIRYIYAILFLFFISLYYLSTPGHTPYDYFTRLGSAFLQGKNYITDNPSWLSELIPSGNNKFYVPYPSMPAILSMPFVYIFGDKFYQEFLGFIFGAGIVVLTTKMSIRIKSSVALAIWAGLTIGLGSIVWYMSSVGSSWYLGQLVAAFFLSAALVESLGKKRLVIVGMFLGASYLSRYHTVLSFPIFIYLLRSKIKNVQNLFKICLSFLPFFLFDSLYNYSRFGVIWNKGYMLIPGVLSEPWFSNGLMNISYIPSHFKVAFLSLPILLNKWPFIKPSWGGLSILFTTPAFLFALSSKLKDKANIAAWLSVVLIFGFVAMHGSTGFVQFGYRFAVDFYPILTFLTIKGVAKTGLKKIHWILLLVGILVNLWGVLWINKFGWVGF